MRHLHRSGGLFADGAGIRVSIRNLRVWLTRMHHDRRFQPVCGGRAMFFIDCVLFCLALRFAVDAPADVRTIIARQRGLD